MLTAPVAGATPAPEQFLGGAAGLSPATVTRLTQQWQADHAAFMDRDLAEVDYVYVWADGIHLNVRLEEAKACVLVLIGVRADGSKELVALKDGYRESGESWADLLRDCARRGMRAPVLAVGDGALGFWKALAEVFPGTREQRCWVHKTANVLDSMPKSAQPGAKKAIQDIYNAENRDHAEAAIKTFAQLYGAKFPKAVKKITDDQEQLLAFYNFPAEHWIHLRTTPHRVHLLHCPAADQGHPRRRQPGRRPGDGLQARRVRSATVAGRERTPPRRPRPRRRTLRWGQTRRTTGSRGSDRGGLREGGAMRIEFTLDCIDLETQSRFWAATLGGDVEDVIEGRYITLSGPGISLTLQRVPEAKTVKNRMHLDLLVDDVQAEVGRLESLGATRLTPAPHQEFGQTWYVMADPEGNEFCLARDPSTKPAHPE